MIKIFIFLLFFIAPQTTWAEHSYFPDCFKESKKISDADSEGYVFVAYSRFCRIDGPLDINGATAILHSGTLLHDQKESQNTYDTLINANVNLPEFLAIFKKRMATSEEEKSKTAKDIYQLSKTAPNYIEDEKLRCLVRSIYLLLASQKDHVLAGEEVTQMTKECPR